MAEMSLSPEEFLSKLLTDEHADVLREGLWDAPVSGTSRRVSVSG